MRSLISSSCLAGSPNEATLPQRVQKMDAWMQKMQSLIEKATRSAEYNTKIVKQSTALTLALIGAKSTQ